MIIDTRHSPLVKALATNSTTAGTSFTTPVDTITDPLGTDGVHPIGRGGCLAPNGLFVKPYAIGNDDVTFLMAIWAIDQIINKSGTHVRPQWTYSLLASFTCTASTRVGLVGGIVLNTERYADTIAVIDGNSNISHEAVSPEGNVAGHVVVDCKAPDLIAFTFAMNSSATSANAVFKRL